MTKQPTIKTKCEDCRKTKECNVFEYNGRMRSQCRECKLKENAAKAEELFTQEELEAAAAKN